MTAGDRRDEGFLGIDGCFDGMRCGNRVRRRRRRNLDSAVERPAMSAAVAVIEERRAVPPPCDRRRVLAQLSAALPALSAAHGGENEDRTPFRSRRTQSIEEADAFTVHKDVHVSSDAPSLIHDALERARRSLSECIERVADGPVPAIENYRRLRPCVGAKRLWQFQRDHAAAVPEAFTHTTGGRPSAISVQFVPPSADPNSFPLRVPK